MTDRLRIGGDAVITEDNATGDILVDVDSVDTERAVIGGANSRVLDGVVAEQLSPVTYNLSQTYDVVEVEYGPSDTGGAGSGNNQAFHVFFNGDNSASYNYRTHDGSTTGGANAVALFLTHQDQAWGRLRVSGRWDDTLVLTNQTYDQFGSVAANGVLPFVGSGTLGSFTITTEADGNTANDTGEKMPPMRIYGREFE